MQDSAIPNAVAETPEQVSCLKGGNEAQEFDNLKDDVLAANKIKPRTLRDKQREDRAKTAQKRLAQMDKCNRVKFHQHEHAANDIRDNRVPTFGEPQLSHERRSRHSGKEPGNILPIEKSSTNKVEKTKTVEKTVTKTKTSEDPSNKLDKKSLRAFFNTAKVLLDSKKEHDKHEQHLRDKSMISMKSRGSLRCSEFNNAVGFNDPRSSIGSDGYDFALSDESGDADVTFKEACTEHDHVDFSEQQVKRMRTSHVMDRMQLPNMMDAESFRFVLAQRRFDMFMGMVVFANFIMIGMEASCQPSATHDKERQGCPEEYFFMVCEHLFLAVYVAELFTRFYAFGVHNSLRSTWVKFDCFLVVTGVLSTWVLTPILKTSDFGQGRLLVFTKILRIVRLARLLRLFVQFRHLWLLVRGLFACVSVMFWSFFLLFILMFFFAILGIDFIGTNDALINHSDPEVQEMARQFSELSTALMTLSNFWLLDDVGRVYKPLVNAQPALALYFLLVILVIAIACMNLVTAIMVQNSIDSAQQDKEAQNLWEEQRRKNLVPKLCDLFRKLDSDESGDLTKDEMLQAPPELTTMLSTVAHVDDLSDLFDTLDVDGSEFIEIDEFCDGMLKASGDPGKPPELLRIAKQVGYMVASLERLEEHLEERDLRELGLSEDGPLVSNFPPAMSMQHSASMNSNGPVNKSNSFGAGASRMSTQRGTAFGGQMGGMRVSQQISGGLGEAPVRNSVQRGTAFTGQIGGMRPSQAQSSTGGGQAPVRNSMQRGTAFTGQIGGRTSKAGVGHVQSGPKERSSTVRQSRDSVCVKKSRDSNSGVSSGQISSLVSKTPFAKEMSCVAENDEDEEEASDAASEEADLGCDSQKLTDHHSDGDEEADFAFAKASKDEWGESQVLDAIAELSERVEQVREASANQINSLENPINQVLSAMAKLSDRVDQLTQNSTTAICKDSPEAVVV